MAFVDEDKYLACSPDSLSSTAIPPSPGCEGHNATSVQSLGGTIEWCLLDETDTSSCVTNNNFSVTHQDSRLIPLNISSTGVLHISRVTLRLRQQVSPITNNLANCSIYNSEGQLCDKVRLELFIYLRGKIFDFTNEY